MINKGSLNILARSIRSIPFLLEYLNFKKRIAMEKQLVLGADSTFDWRSADEIAPTDDYCLRDFRADYGHV
jgi:hypothetical protein